MRALPSAPRRLRRAALPVAALALALLGAAEDAPPAPDDGRSGRDVYACVLGNRFRAYVQEAKLVSGDRGDAAQESRLRMSWKNFRDELDAPRHGVLSKTLVRYEHPFDLRFSGYLVINNASRPNDQFVYLAATRKIRRVNLRKEAVFGTDFTFEDIVPNEIEDADYRRLGDGAIDGHAVYVVEVTPKPESDSEYSRFVVYVEKESCVPLRTRYWDEKGVEVKELTVPYEAVRQFQDVHWPMQLTMRSLKLDTFTTLTVEDLEPNAKLPDGSFEVRRLMSH
jgi:Outer membrane lipoprotein-sorting protein